MSGQIVDKPSSGIVSEGFELAELDFERLDDNLWEGFLSFFLI
jgi:hypothetical protein